MFSLFDNTTQLNKTCFLYKIKITENYFNRHLTINTGIYHLNLGYITNKYIPSLKDHGSYIIMLETHDNNPTHMSFPFNGIFCLCKSAKHNLGVVNPLCTTNDDQYDRFIDVLWNQYEYPSIVLKWYSIDTYYKLANYLKGTPYEISFNITILN